MIILPPKEIQKYITMNEEGNWCCSEEMPIGLQGKFAEFLEQIREAQKYKRNLDNFK